jgi:transcriptional regulator with XRE-family HTH domain
MAHPVDEYVGKRLRKRRNDLGISQEALAKSSGITFQQVQKYERATNRISVSRMYEFASVLRVPISYFFQGMPSLEEYGFAEEVSGFEHEPAQYDNDLQEIIEAYKSIDNPEARRTIKMMIQGVANGSTVIS